MSHLYILSLVIAENAQRLQRSPKVHYLLHDSKSHKFQLVCWDTNSATISLVLYSSSKVATQSWNNINSPHNLKARWIMLCPNARFSLEDHTIVECQIFQKFYWISPYQKARISPKGQFLIVSFRLLILFISSFFSKNVSTLYQYKLCLKGQSHLYKTKTYKKGFIS